MAKGDDLQERLIGFAARVIQVCDALPNTEAGKHIGNQLVRSGSSPAANHAEAKSAESTADFIHKLKIAVKELNESEVWLRIIVTSKMMKQSKLNDLLNECKQLQKIISARPRFLYFAGAIFSLAGRQITPESPAAVGLEPFFQRRRWQPHHPAKPALVAPIFA